MTVHGHGTRYRALLVEPRRPLWVRSRADAHWLVVATVCVGAFMGQLDASIVTVAFPTMQHDFQASLGAVEWVALSYLLVLVATVTAVGRFADMAGRKLLYTYGFALFSLASAACGLAPNLAVLDVTRVIQALGAAMLQANSVALIATAMPAHKLGRGIGVQGAAQALGLALGPTVGGLLIALGGWRLIFFVNVPVGIAGTLLGWFLLPRSRHLQQRTPFDWWGLAAFLPATGALLAALSLGRDLGFGSPAVAVLFAVSAAATVLFVRRQRRAASPLVNPALFRRLAFTSGIVSGFLSYAVLFGVLFAVPFLLEGAFGLSTGTAGLLLTALPAALGLTAPVAGRLADRVGARPLTVGGMLLTAAALLTSVFAHGAPWLLATELAAVGVGLGLFTPPNNAAIMASAPREQSGSAGGLLNMTRGFGTAMGVALAGLMLGAGTVQQAAGQHAVAASHGYVYAAALLAALALPAAGFAALRGRVPAR